MFCRRQKKDEQTVRSKELDKWIENEEKRKPISILLLGTGESGKTTLMKQMKIIHINGYSQKEKQDYVPYIRSNLQESIHDIVANVKRLTPRITFDEETDGEVEEAIEYVLKYGPVKVLSNEDDVTPMQFPDVYYEKVKLLWNHDKIQTAYRRSNEYQLIDCAGYMLDRLDLIKRDDYVPTVDDILHCRKRTTTITSIDFDMPYSSMYASKKVRFRVTDVGGQRGERKKWIRVFSGVDVILFLIASSDYDQRLREDNKTNRLEESFNLYNEICWNSFLRDSGLIVFLNKQDLLERKLNDGTSKLENYFDDYKDYVRNTKIIKNDYEMAKTFMKDKIEALSQSKNMKLVIVPNLVKEVQVKSREPYVHYTTAVDTQNIKLVFEDVKDHILKSNMRSVV